MNRSESGSTYWPREYDKSSVLHLSESDSVESDSNSEIDPFLSDANQPAAVSIARATLGNAHTLGEASRPNASKFREVFKTQEGFNDFRGFLTNIFMQLDEDKFEVLMKDILADDSLTTDEQIYEVLSSRIAEARKGICGINSFGLGKIGSLLAALRSLGKLKGDLAEQVKTVMGNMTNIDGYLEIGYPGRMIRPIMGKLKMNGPIIVVNDGEDLVQRGFPFTRPYNKIVPLNDYAPISEETAADSSLDMVTCFIGLHHTPDDGHLEQFVESIHRVLRPGGSFILMDHDASSIKLWDLCWVVHGVFNAATGETPETDRNEYRDFHSLDYWQVLLDQYGFDLETAGADYQIRAGDPTQNTVVRFRKRAENQKEFAEALNRTPGYGREQWKTYSSIPEWYNVRHSQAYADFLGSNDMNQFSFLKNVANYWKVFGNSWNAAREHSGFWEMMKSDFIVMDLFIGVTMTLECLYRAIASLPLWLLNSESRKGVTNQLKAAIAGDASEYSQFINHTPFYSYPYFKQVRQFWTHYLKSLATGEDGSFKWKNPVSREALGNLYLTIIMSLEYLSKGVASAPIAWMYGSGGLKEAETIGMLIDVSDVSVEFEDLDELDELDDRVKVKEKFAELMSIESPRYIPDTKVMINLSEKGVQFINIAGRDKVAVKVNLPESAIIPDDYVNGARAKFDYPDPTSADRKFTVLDVDVPSLHQVLNKLREEGVEIEGIYVHDF